MMIMLIFYELREKNDPYMRHNSIYYFRTIFLCLIFFKLSSIEDYPQQLKLDGYNRIMVYYEVIIITILKDQS